MICQVAVCVPGHAPSLWDISTDVGESVLRLLTVPGYVQLTSSSGAAMGPVWLCPCGSAAVRSSMAGKRHCAKPVLEVANEAPAHRLQGAEADASFWFDNSGSTPPLAIADIFNDPADYQTAVSAL